MGQPDLPIGTVETMLKQMQDLAVAFRSIPLKMATLSDFGDESRRVAAALPSVGDTLTSDKTTSVFWKSDMFQAAIRGCEVLVGTPCPAGVIPATPQYWYFENDLLLENFERTGYGLNSLMIISEITQMGIFMKNASDSSSEDDRIPRLNIDRLPAVGQLIEMKHAAIIAGFMFMQSTVAEAVPAVIPRHLRRQALRRHETLPTVSVVHLRRRESSGVAASTGADREWSCQWLVKGHWRRLKQPRKKDGALVTYVSPCVKGPIDKPLRSPRESVVAVVR